MDAVNSIFGLTRGSLFSFMMQHWKQSTWGGKIKEKKKRDKYLFTSCILKIFQNIKLAKKHRYTYIKHTTSAKLLIVLILAISSKKEKKGYLHGLQVKNPWVLLIKYHVVKQTFYLHKLLKAVLEILLSTHAH